MIETEDYSALSKKCLYFCKSYMIMYSESVIACVSGQLLAGDHWTLNPVSRLREMTGGWGPPPRRHTTLKPPPPHGLILHSGTIKVCSCWNYSVSSRTPPGKTSNCCGSHWESGCRVGHQKIAAGELFFCHTTANFLLSVWFDEVGKL